MATIPSAIQAVKAAGSATKAGAKRSASYRLSKPIERQNSTIEDTPIAAPVDTPIQDTIITGEKSDRFSPPESEESRLRRVIRAAVIRAQTDDTVFSDEFARLYDVDGPSQFHSTGEAMLLAEAQRQAAAFANFQRTFWIEQAVAGEHSQVVIDALGLIDESEKEALSDVNIGTTAYANSSFVGEVSPETRADLMVRLELLDQIAEIGEQTSGWTIAGGILLEMVLLPKAIYDNWQLTGQGNIFEHSETVRRTFTWFQGLSPEEKRKFFPIMKEMAQEALPAHRVPIFLAALLDPSQEALAADQFGLWPIIDVLFIASGVAGLALRLKKLLNPVRVAAAAGDTKRAAEMNMTLLQAEDDALGELLDIPRVTAINNAGPFKMLGVDDAAAARVSPEAHERIFQFRDKIRAIFDPIIEGKSFIREGFLQDGPDRRRAIDRIVDEYNLYIDERFRFNDKIINVDSQGIAGKKVPATITVKDTRVEDSRGITFTFEVTNADGSVIKDTYKGMFQLDDVGMFQNLRGGVWFRSLRSEKSQNVKTDFWSITKAALRLDHVASGLHAKLAKLTREAAKPIRQSTRNIGKTGGKTRKDRIKEVDDILITGDELLREFSPRQLKYEGVNGIKLDDAQMEYYYNIRGIMNGLGIVRNMDDRASKLARNVKEIVLGGKNGLALGEVLDLPQATRRVKGSITDVKTIYKWDEKTGKKVEVNRLNLKEEYDKGFRLISLEEDILVNTGGKSRSRFKHILIHTDDINPLPMVVTDIRKGYIPRVNPKAIHFVQALIPDYLDGLSSIRRKAIRSFDTELAANDFIRNYDAIIREHGLPPLTKLKVIKDTELEALRAGDTGLSGIHGLVYSKRSKKPVPHNDGDGTDTPRLSALESIELYLQNTTSFLSRNDWRLGMQMRWEKTARFHLEGENISFRDPGVALKNERLRIAHEKISHFGGFSDKSEKMWEAGVIKAHEWAVGKVGSEATPAFILNQRTRDPLTRLRSATFHLLLGWFNPVQLWVQAQGAAVMLGVNIVHPIRLQRAFRQMHGLALLQHGKFLRVNKLSKDKRELIAKSTGFKNWKELEDTKAAWDRTGLYDSVLSSADVEAAARGFPMTGSMLERFASSGLMFFRTGEIFTRRMSFLSAIDELGGIGKVVASEQLLKKALDRTNDLILNLGKSNRASWQKGPLSIPTQFMQIQAKTIESLIPVALGGNAAFTKIERAGILTAQLGLYGTAGIFGGNWIARNVMSGLGINQIDINEAPSWQIDALNGGFTDWFAKRMSADIVASDRGALLNGMDQTVWSLFTDENTFFETFMGPSGVWPTRMYDAMHQMSPWFATPQDINGQVDLTDIEILDSLRSIAMDIGTLALSPFGITSQFNKARFMYDMGVLKNKRGDIIARPKEGFNLMTEIATLIGFKPELQQLKFDLSVQNQRDREYMEWRVTLMLHGWDRFQVALEKSRQTGVPIPDDELQRFRLERSTLVDTMPFHLRNQVMNSYQAKIRGREKGSQLERQRQIWWKRGVVDIADGWFDPDVIAENTRIIQTTAPTPTIQEDE